MIVFEEYLRRRLLGGLDPRVRVLCLAGFAVVICLCRKPSVLAAGLAVSIALLILSGAGLKLVARRMGAVNLFMLLLLVTLPPLVPGVPAWSLGPVAWSAEGLHRTLEIAARANAVMAMTIALLGGLASAHLGFALSGVGVPDRFTHLLLFLVRYLEIIHQEYHRLRDAMALRAFRPGFSRHAFRTLGFLVGQLLVRSAQRAERILDAMACRGFRGRFYVLAPWRIRPPDVVFGVAVFAGLLAMVMWEMR